VGQPVLTDFCTQLTGITQDMVTVRYSFSFHATKYMEVTFSLNFSTGIPMHNRES
jgi:inhibitor of KinA sporulation pathway (predicted exonuclease)